MTDTKQTEAARPVFVPGGKIPTLLEITQFRKRVAEWEAERDRKARESYIRDSASTAGTLAGLITQRIVNDINKDCRVKTVTIDWALTTQYSGRTLSAYLSPSQYQLVGIPPKEVLLELLKSLLAESEIKASFNTSATSLHVTLDLAPSGI